MSRRSRTSRRRTYGKRQHEVRERRPAETQEPGASRRDDGWLTPDLMDDAGRRDAAYDGYDAYDAEGWTR